MTGYLLDTNVVSEMRKGPRADTGVSSWFDEHRLDEMWLSVLVIGELRRGVELLRRRDAASAHRLDEWLDGVADRYQDWLLPVTVAVCEQWALITVPDPARIVDGLMAATARVHDLTLVTRNVGDVARTGVQVENPFAT